MLYHAKRELETQDVKIPTKLGSLFSFVSTPFPLLFSLILLISTSFVPLVASECFLRYSRKASKVNRSSSSLELVGDTKELSLILLAINDLGLACYWGDPVQFLVWRQEICRFKFLKILRCPCV